MICCEQGCSQLTYEVMHSQIPGYHARLHLLFVRTFRSVGARGYRPKLVLRMWTKALRTFFIAADGEHSLYKMALTVYD